MGQSTGGGQTRLLLVAKTLLETVELPFLPWDYGSGKGIRDYLSYWRGETSRLCFGQHRGRRGGRGSINKRTCRQKEFSKASFF